MRSFEDRKGRRWRATVKQRDELDYKGRFYFHLEPVGERVGEGVALEDIRWNSEHTARRTLETMSETELRRRLRQAVGRDRGPVSSGEG